MAASTKADKYVRIPTQADLRLTAGAAYVHMTSNNTIEGTEWKDLPQVGDVPLVSDTSSDMFSRPLDVSRHALIYAGAQKNMGPAGLTVVIVRDDLLERSRARASVLPTMLNYAVHADNKSLYNTPPVVAVYVLGLVMKWLTTQGGLAGIETANRRKAAKLYAEIDRTGFYRGTALADSRSMMNVTFRLPSEELEAKFVKESAAAGLDGLKGHRAVGGHARVDLQRLSRGRRRRARVVHAGLRAERRIAGARPDITKIRQTVSFHSVASNTGVLP